MKKLKEIESQLSKKDRDWIAAHRHPHCQSLKYYSHKVGLTRRLDYGDFCWLNQNTTGPYSQDFTIAPHNISFQNASDAVLFKLTFSGTLACKPHIKL